MNIFKDLVLTCETSGLNLETITEIVTGHYHAHQHQVFNLKVLSVDRTFVGRDEAILKHLSCLVRMMRCISKVNRLYLDYRDYEFISAEINARRDGFIVK